MINLPKLHYPILFKTSIFKKQKMKMNQNNETIDMTRKHAYFSKKNIAFQNALNKISNRFLY